MESFITLASGANVLKLFSSSLMLHQNKSKHLSLPSLSSLKKGSTQVCSGLTPECYTRRERLSRENTPAYLASMSVTKKKIYNVDNSGLYYKHVP